MSDSIQTKRRRKDPQTILCDMCIEDRKPAKKTCMKCEISMCVQHLQAHLTTPVLLQTHPLTEPMDLCGNTKCSQVYPASCPKTASKGLSTPNDPEKDNPLGPGMSLSTDNRKVFHSQWMKFCSSNLFLIKGTVLVSDFKGWVIGISKDCDWTIGLCDDTYAASMTGGYIYGLRCQGNQLFSLTTEYSLVMIQSEHSFFGMQKIETPQQHYKVSQQVINTPGGNVEPQMTRPQIVEVVWSFPDSLSFFSRIGQHQRINLLTVTISSTSSDLKPFVCLQGLEKEATNEFSFSSSLTTSQFGGFPQQYQNQSKCSCRKIKVKSGHGFNYGAALGSNSSQSICSCGKIIGSPPMTAVLCELL
ncbi:uncharacterized protein LOC118453393 [Neolamprologus brichardi]|uniref:uncharacterized protein LOC118453393 n=1 Tax=Neolamprologus brichardi TaxID=32507 RepID=UPI001643B055|nr:uncharacterized protein LOC118453393 [Neolamprologus brichardi]